MPKKERNLLGERMRKSEAPAGFKNKPLLSALPLSEGSADIAVIGNIVDTTVSDERLKTNIQDVESNYCDCIKNVKIKTFEYKDEKYKKSDKYGFIAQHLQKHLPKRI